MNNDDLKQKYDQMHAQGPDAWYSDGTNERREIIKSMNWKGKTVLEVGCGEGDLAVMIKKAGAAAVRAIDYSPRAIETALNKHDADQVRFFVTNYRDCEKWKCDILVMQGVLEHLGTKGDKQSAFKELNFMIKKFNPRWIITSSPCFCNLRGIIWLTADLLGYQCSLTDLHFFYPWDFKGWADQHHYSMLITTTDQSWAWELEMERDLNQRLSKMMEQKGGCLTSDQYQAFTSTMARIGRLISPQTLGATMVVKIDRKSNEQDREKS